MKRKRMENLSKVQEAEGKKNGFDFYNASKRTRKEEGVTECRMLPRKIPWD